MTRPFRGRRSKLEMVLRHNALDSFYAGAAGVPPKNQLPLPAKRNTIRRPVDGKPAMPLEREVLAAVLKALRADRRVALCERSQSGLFQDGERYIRVGTPGKLDITIMLVGGRYGEIEVKRPGTKPDERQALRISTIIANGGIAGFATSAEEALALLP